MSRLIRAAALGVALVMASAAPAAAQSPDPEILLAKKHFELGRTYYEQGAYDQALAAFKEAYRLSKRAPLLFNIARCLESLGRLEEAIAQYKAYLQAMGSRDPNIIARIRNLERRVASRPRPAPAPAPAPAPKPKPRPVVKPKPRPVVKPKPRPVVKPKPVAKPGPGPRAKPIARPAPAPPPQAEGPSRWLLWTGIGAIAAGAGGIAAGVALGLAASKKADAVDRAYGQRNHVWSSIQPIEDRGKSLQVGSIVAYAAGGAVLAGGIVMAILSPSGDSPRRASVAPLIGPGLVGVGGGFNF